jgi:hypothetical protein
MIEQSARITELIVVAENYALDDETATSVDR